PEMLGFLSTYIPITILVSLLTLFLGSMIIKMVYDSTRKKLSLGVAAKFVLSRYITLLAASVLYFLITLVGVVAFIIPGIFLAVKLIFYDYVILIDKLGVTDSLEKSWKIVKGRWWGVFGLTLILSVISFALAFALGVLGGLLSGLSEALSEVIWLATQFLITLFIFPWYTSSLAFAYLQLRKK
ncbi:MAG: hypothetical protein QMD12_02125, partial [Candidatus Aenigmarchaeota archaeon]|nr:hypothetical protein [Candidatus Aenigmarchaeota archaeon]